MYTQRQRTFGVCHLIGPWVAVLIQQVDTEIGNSAQAKSGEHTPNERHMLHFIAN